MFPKKIRSKLMGVLDYQLMVYISMKELLLPLLILLPSTIIAKDDQQPIDNNLLPEAMKQVDVNKTIEEVQAILAKNTTLPRLTRGEILALLQDVTKDVQPQSVHQRKEKNNNLLLVMPVKINGSNLDNIYSITPVTKLVRPGEPETEASIETSTKPYNSKIVTQKPGGKPARRRRPSTTTESSKGFSRFSLSDLLRTTTQAVTKSTYMPVTTMRPNVGMYLNYVTRQPLLSSTGHKGQSFDLPDTVKNNLQAFDLGNHKYSSKNRTVNGDSYQNNFQLIQNISFDSPSQDTKFGMGAVSTAIRVSDNVPALEKARPVFTHPTMISLTDPNDKGVDKPHYNHKAVEGPSYNHKTKLSDYSSNQFGEEDSFPSSTKTSKIKMKVTTSPPQFSTTEFSMNVPQDSLTPEMKNILVSLGLLNPETGKIVQDSPEPAAELPDTSATIFNLKPMTPSVDPESYSKFKPIPVDGTNPKSDNTELSSDMKDFLASFGLISESKPSSKKNYDFDFSRRGQKALQFNRDRDYINNETSSEFLSDLASLELDSADNDSIDSTAEDASHNMSLSTDMLSDDMKDVLQNLGLIEEQMALKGNKLLKQHVFNPAVHTALLKDTTEAKKIKKLWHAITDLSKDSKTNDLSQDELKTKIDNITTAVLTGNLTHESYIMKIINQNKNKMKTPPSKNETEAIESIKTLTKNLEAEETKDPEKALEELENVGTEEIETEAVVKLEESGSTSENEDLKDSDGMEMLNSSANPSIVKPVGSSSGNLNQVMDPPDPLSSHELQMLFENHQRNEFKRQQPSDAPDSSSTTLSGMSTSSTSTDATSSETSTDNVSSVSSEGSTSSGDTMVETSTTRGDDEKAEMPSGTDSSASASLDQLADSFGGGGVASNPPTNEELPAATLRPNGLYFYVDWNTFLNVGEEDKKPVNLKFAPKVGNPRLFLPITVP